MIMISDIRGREILDSRGNPTVEADDQLANKSLAQLPLRELGLMVLGIQRANGGSSSPSTTPISRHSAAADSARRSHSPTV